MSSGQLTFPRAVEVSARFPKVRRKLRNRGPQFPVPPVVAVIVFVLALYEWVAALAALIIGVLKLLSVEPVASAWGWAEIGLLLLSTFVAAYLRHIMIPD